MRPRRPSRSDRYRANVYAIQRIRLEGLLTGAYTPRCDREAMYLDLRRRGVRVAVDDFILSPALLLLETMTPEPDAAADTDDQAGDDEADHTFTPPSEPAIPPG
ncbi:hypothetical protein [uncultured Brevundimonas sp.]|uniref:hypothetical protein n=1 Tax=uncultured Brevundimonas sp. TaxID=213418 RepID=UPI0030EE83F1|tara:strand:+ start:718 stop:1029 length:312 start_codon:yes stop_codon:yes gene_type:complete